MNVLPCAVLCLVLMALAIDEKVVEEVKGAQKVFWHHAGQIVAPPVWIPNLQPDFNVRVLDGLADSLTLLRELDESNRFIQKSAESTSI